MNRIQATIAKAREAFDRETIAWAIVPGTAADSDISNPWSPMVHPISARESGRIRDHWWSIAHAGPCPARGRRRRRGTCWSPVATGCWVASVRH